MRHLRDADSQVFQVDSSYQNQGAIAIDNKSSVTVHRRGSRVHAYQGDDTQGKAIECTPSFVDFEFTVCAKKARNVYVDCAQFSGLSPRETWVREAGSFTPLQTKDLVFLTQAAHLGWPQV
jgi:hypothetical protein